MTYYYFLYIFFKTTKTNLSYSNILNNNRFEISPNKFEVITHFKSSKKITVSNHPEIDYSVIKGYSNIAPLIDLITLSSKIIISNEYNGLAFKSDSALNKNFYNKDISFRDFLNKIKSKNPLYKFSMGDEWPIIIKKNEEINFNDDKIDFIKYLLDNICSKPKINSISISLLNYWRIGYSLQELWLWQESYLNYFKIIEYFLEKNRSILGNLPIIKKIFNYFTKKSLLHRTILKMLNDFSIDTNTVKIKLVKDFNKIRNNKDIAHKKIKKQLTNQKSIIRAELFNLSYYDELWDYWEDIRELSRFLILKYLGLKKIELKIEADFLEIKLLN